MKFLKAPLFLIAIFQSSASAERLRRGESDAGVSPSQGEGRGRLLERLLRQIGEKIEIEGAKIEAGMREGLRESSGFGVPLFPREEEGGDRRLSTPSAGYNFTQCPDERPCDAVIATYTQAEVKNILDTILPSITNVDGCLDQFSEFYGSCRVPSNCVCPTFINPNACFNGLVCVQPICPDQCYERLLAPA